MSVYYIDVDFLPDGEEHIISCCIKDCDPAVKGYYETREWLEQQGFYKDDVKLSIGEEGENDYLLEGTRLGHYDYDVDYLKDGMACHLLNITNTKRFRFGICWIHNLSKDEENYDT